MRSTTQKPRPKHLDLFRIKLPLTGIVSIAHRISGVLLVLSIPFWLYLLDLSLSSEAGYAEAVQWLDGFFVSFLAIIVLWALMHHFFAGIRFLLLDIDIGIEKEQALKFAQYVLIAEGVSMLFVIGWVL
ncbi:MAG: succinate dehydrogenase, cytochrome b556 subunit [Gammaproteobacteria bacterium]|nr:succinate dehydrogenase, cytochrome b556 subunit [Gammaproteobacteria bacterium]